ncbi:MAG: cyclase, partial [Gemmatimonadales bacterium]
MIRLRTLGALDLRGPEGQELRPVLAQPKRAAVLAYLALATPRGPHRRDTLLALFWPEQDTEHARNALSQAIHFLRRSLGGEVLAAHNGEGLGLDWKNFWCDAAIFEEALDGGRFTEALDLYRGDLLEGFHVADAPEFGQWLENERARLAS